MFIKKGAMFGLDARIALAIFGALSVISGAALYSAIEQSRLENSRQRFIETAKAVEQFLLDTGKMPDLLTTTAAKISHIVKDTSIPNWQGPYIDSIEISDGLIDSQGNPRYQFFLLRQKNDDLGAATGSAASNSGVCTVVTDCGYWLKTHIRTSDMQVYPSAESYALKLDELIDGGDGDSKGNLRINWYGSDKTDPILFYYVIPVYSL
jgi:type II secretory pathway pseudopilin PulG